MLNAAAFSYVVDGIKKVLGAWDAQGGLLGECQDLFVVVLQLHFGKCFDLYEVLLHCHWFW